MSDLPAGKPLDIVAELTASWVTMAESAPVCLVSKTHAVELHDLTDAAAIAFMRDARRVSAALAASTGAVKINYEVHGNTLPHLHIHFFPRYRGDRFEDQPINPKFVTQPVYLPGEFQRTLDVFWDTLRSVSGNRGRGSIVCRAYSRQIQR